MPPKKLTPDSYRVGWICPLEVEQIAAMEMLDEEHLPIDQSSADHNVYKLGSINGHNVVIAGLHQTGNCPAATVVTQMRMTFQNLRYGLLVGIGGGVPVETESGMIRLGHVVVSKPTGEHSGAIQYDHGKAREGRFERVGFLMPPPAALLNAAQALAVQRDRMDYDPVWKDTLRFKTERRGLRRFKFPGIENDHLYQPDYSHQQEGISCEKAGCSPEQKIERPVDEGDEFFVVVHRGTVASGELVIKDAKQRDCLAQQYGLLCFEMEAAGALVDFPCIVIRGISDYCDSHKNDSWHGFAAAAAAAYARQLLFHTPIELVKETGITTTSIVYPSRAPNSQHETAAFDLPFYLPKINRVSKFIAREEELTKMQEALQGTVKRRRVAVLHGLGGIGKTQLAMEYAHRHRKDYSTSVWLDARSETAINQSFAQLADRILNYDPSVSYISIAVKSQDQSGITAAVKRWFDEAANNSWLIIYDNYDHPDLSSVGTDKKAFSLLPQETPSQPVSVDPKNEVASELFDIRKYLPATDHGAIIVTTRVSLKRLGNCIQVSKFEHLDDSLEIIVSTSGRESIKQDGAAADLARRLDGLPLALASAGAYLEQVPMTCHEYLQLYETSWVQLHESTPELPSYDKALCTTWNISYMHIEEQNPNAALLLRQWAYFDNSDLWYELLQDGGSYKQDWFRELTRNSLTFHSIMRLLCNHGLVQANLPNTTDTVRRPESAGYSVHACVHSWMVHVINRDPCKEMARAALHCVGSHVPGEKQPEFWSKQRRLLRHADRCYDMMRTTHVEDEDAWLLHSLGLLYRDQGRFSEAEVMFKRALQGKEKAWGPDHTSTLGTVHSLALLYTKKGQLSEAEAMYTRALQGYEKAKGLDDEFTLMIFNNLGILYNDQGLLDKAEAMSTRALEGYEKERGPDHTSTLGVVNNLGILYKAQGRLNEAKDMYKRALQGCEKAWGLEHTSTLIIVNNLGKLYAEQGQFNKAEAMYKRALHGKEKAWGPDHILTLVPVHNLGNLYKNQGRLDKAEAMYKRALQGRERVLGPDHTATLDTANDLGSLYKNQGRLDKAEAMYKRALQGYEKTLGQGHTSTLITVYNLGILYADQSRLNEAETMYTRALQGRERALGPYHKSTLNTANDLGNFYKNQGRLNEAEAIYKRALQGYERALGHDMEAYVPALDCLENFGNLCYTRGKVQDARRYYVRAQKGLCAVFGPDGDRIDNIVKLLKKLDVEDSIG